MMKMPHLSVCFILLFGLDISGCSEQVPDRHNPLKALADSSGQFEQPSVANEIRFPQAHAPHKSYRQEWWYLSANLTTETGQSLATQWTLFRRSVEQKHWYFAHAALADAQQHHTAFRSGREELGNVMLNTQPFEATIDDWRWLSTASLLPAQLVYGSLVDGKISERDSPLSASDLPLRNNHWQVKLNLSSEVPFFLQGEHGFSKKHHTLDIASHYYSQPFIAVSGQVYWQGKWQSVSGNAWLDREWGSQMLAQDQHGWDWFSLRLNENTALMVYRIRSELRDYRYGSIMKRSGEIRTLSADDITLVQTGINSSTDNSSYPQSFSLVIAKEGINLAIDVVNNKQIMRFGIEYVEGIEYFEGMVKFTGSHQGQGFLEMTGYEK